MFFATYPQIFIPFYLVVLAAVTFLHIKESPCMVAKLKLKGIVDDEPDLRSGLRIRSDPSNRWFDVLWAPTGRMDPPVFPWRIAFSSVPLTSAALVSD